MTLNGVRFCIPDTFAGNQLISAIAWLDAPAHHALSVMLTVARKWLCCVGRIVCDSLMWALGQAAMAIFKNCPCRGLIAIVGGHTSKYSARPIGLMTSGSGNLCRQALTHQ